MSNFERTSYIIIKDAVNEYRFLREINQMESGHAWQKAFGSAIGGVVSNSRTGDLADVKLDGVSWQVKAIGGMKRKTIPTEIPLLSARISPTADRNVENVVPNWNLKIRHAKNDCNELREIVLIDCQNIAMEPRNSCLVFEFLLEEITEDVEWRKEFRKSGSKGVYYGYNSAGNQIVRWQPSGGQFTIMKTIPQDRYRVIAQPKVPTQIAGTRDGEDEIIDLGRFDHVDLLYSNGSVANLK